MAASLTVYCPPFLFPFRCSSFYPAEPLKADAARAQLFFSKLDSNQVPEVFQSNKNGAAMLRMLWKSVWLSGGPESHSG